MILPRFFAAQLIAKFPPESFAMEDKTFLKHRNKGDILHVSKMD